MRNYPIESGRLTPEEFLAFEANASGRRHEYVSGRIYTMTGTTARHNQIVVNILSRLTSAIAGGPCKAYFLDLMVRPVRDRFYYPDAVVTCVPHDDEALLIPEPCLIVEVTSRSTRRTDWGEKLDAYQQIPSLRGYLVAEHKRRHATLQVRQADGSWERVEAIASGTLHLPCPVVDLSIDEIYRGIEMPPLKVREGFETDPMWLEPDEEFETV